MLFQSTQCDNHAFKKYDNQPQSIEFTKTTKIDSQRIQQFIKLKYMTINPSKLNLSKNTTIKYTKK